jgi:hypothetical protein
MAELVWDRVEDRRFETGVDRGVLYPANGDLPAAWNGLVSVAESPGREAKPYYQDGIKRLERLIAPDYSAKIQAFTYPDLLDELMGNQKQTSGAVLHDQVERLFHLSYRTRIGSALDGIDHGYRIHVVYNLLINPSDVSYETIGDQASAATFEWTVTGRPKILDGKPVTHISFDSTTLDPEYLTWLEDQLYGTAEGDAYMPEVSDLTTWP